ncbi:uncharacterized protein LOC106644978 [Copidosoma floridanum]|uniref:Odorant-binding protein 5 n=1 Tax=Copidosoma floridanum TaxID=29053 RepID=V9ZC03_COPFL|nr:uncharacterized protein LOC106644978 [Copidosoma floridanum]AHE40947.1 odorant-binding protein 5 precursor [Copidosoma floridanum]
MNKLLMLTFALSINFVLSGKSVKEALEDIRLISRLQNYCYNETGFTREKHELIRDARTYSSDINYFCYVGCYCTHVKDLWLTKRTLNYEAVAASVTRFLSVPVAYHVINQCTNISTNSLCATGKKIHDCFAERNVIITGSIGYFDGDEI